MIDLVENRNGIWWPVNEKVCYRHTASQIDVPDEIMKHISNFGTIVQAGGNAGWYTKLYADKFNRVYVLEPDYKNFLCLTLNNPGPNVIKIQACLGNKHDSVNFYVEEKNRGANFIVESDHEDKNLIKIPMITIDDLSLTSCDLIHLDIEGYEYFALLGARDTILKYKPVIAFEYNGSEARYNLEKTAIFDLLTEYNYKQVGSCREELIFKTIDVE